MFVLACVSLSVFVFTYMCLCVRVFGCIFSIVIEQKS